MAALVISCAGPRVLDGSADILDRLNALPGVKAFEIETHFAFTRSFKLVIKQPLDHDKPNRDIFTQTVYLHHLGDSLPMVFAPSGYATSHKVVHEVASYFPSNHLTVPHRFFHGAQPRKSKWEYMTARQAAADHHRIVTLLKTIYPAPWVNVGVSKGGLTALFHKRYYPDDVQATLAYVAPFIIGPKDPVPVDYLRSLGTDECRANLLRFQRMCLENRDSVLPYLKKYYRVNGYRIPRKLPRVLEAAVLKYTWSFWQYSSAICEDIPDEGASAEQIAVHLKDVVWLWRWTNYGRARFAPYHFQAHHELGYPATDTVGLSDLLTFFYQRDSTDTVKTGDSAFDYAVVPDLVEWLETHGDNIVYIYGADDPWTGRAIESTGTTNALRIIQPGFNHRVKIVHLADPQPVYDALESWLGVEIDLAWKPELRIPIPGLDEFLR